MLLTLLLNVMRHKSIVFDLRLGLHLLLLHLHKERYKASPCKISCWTC